jgi:hypothetical protein
MRLTPEKKTEEKYLQATATAQLGCAISLVLSHFGVL